VFNDTEIHILGANYSFTTPESVWQLLRKCSPNAIILSCRPDKNIPNFKINLKNPKTGKFSSRKYIDQITLKENILFSNSSILQNTKSALEKFFWVDFSQKGLLIDPESNEVLVNNNPQIQRNRLTEKIPEEIMNCVSLFSLNSNCPLILGDLPDITHRERICNLLTISQLKEILKQSSFGLGRSPELSPRFPVSVCYNNIHPVNGQGNGWGNPFYNFFTPANDLYMAMLIANLSVKGLKKNSKKRNKIFVLSTPGSNKGIQYFLKQIESGEIPHELLFKKSKEDAQIHLGDLFEVPDPVTNLFSKTYIEELVEKSAIWDVLMDPYKPTFKNSDAIIRKYLNKEDYKEMTLEEIEMEKKQIQEINRTKGVFDQNKATRELSYQEKFDELEHLYRNLYLEYQKLFFRSLNKGKAGLEKSYYKEALKSV
jgi:hypothetical protein